MPQQQDGALETASYQSEGRVKTLVLPVAGMGKRLRPLTLHLPKALVPLRGKPLVEYAIEETRGTDIEHVVIIASPNHRESIEKYLEEKAPLFPNLRFSLRIQDTPAGNGHAVLQAVDLIHGPFVVRFCDDVLFSHASPIQALAGLYATHRVPIMLLERVPHERVSSYGVVKAEEVDAPGQLPGSHVYEIRGVVEKPTPQDAPSDLAIVGGYILDQQILEDLARIMEALPEVKDDGLLLTDAFEAELLSGGKIFGWEFPGLRFDCGNLASLASTEEFLEKQSQEE